MPTPTEGVTFETYDNVTAELERVEARLAAELGLPVDGIRGRLVAAARSGALVETTTVAEWHRRYAAYVDWSE